MLAATMPTALRLTYVVSIVCVCACVCAWAPAAAGDARAGGKSRKPTRTAPTAAPLVIKVDKSKVDLKEHRLEITLSRSTAKLTLRVEGESGATLAEDERELSGGPPWSPVILTWTPSSSEPVARIEVKAVDGDAQYTEVISSYFVSIDHVEVNFKTGSAVIEDAEVPKLEAAHATLAAKLATIRARDVNKEHRNLTLFIAGHTDTVGGAEYNLGLSRDRARAIAAWFRHRGVAAAIAYEGFGETSPAVPTADQVDEPRNRRVDYVVGDDLPNYKTTGFKPVWKRAN
jgi:outer membrane protein OmpA-like peptidoglycan-associated protein